MTSVLSPRAASLAEPPLPRSPHAMWPTIGAVAVVLSLGALPLLGTETLPFRPACALLALIGVPVWVLSRRVRWGLLTSAERLTYAAAITVLGVMVTGLLLNTALPALGVGRPLRREFVVGASVVVDLALVLWRPRTPLAPVAGWRGWCRQAVGARVESAQLVATAALVAAVIGAIRLNNDAGGGPALAGRVLCGIALLLLVLRNGTTGRDLRTIGLVATALLASTSLRGWSITGHDIQREYIAFLLTDGGQHWSMAPFQSPYNACLSVNILPTVVAQATGLSGVVVFKVVLQFAMVLVATTTYLATRRVLSRRHSVAAVAVLMMFPTFFTDMPYLVRQEVAFMFLATALLAAGQPHWRVWSRRAFVVVLGGGVVISHYSTTYMLLIGLALGVVGFRGSALLRRLAGTSRPAAAPVLLSVVVVLPLVAMTWLWSGPLTHTGSHAEETAERTISLLLGQGEAGPESSDVSYTLIPGTQLSAQQRLDRFARQTVELN